MRLILLLRYHLHSTLRNFRFGFAPLFFGISFILFLFILIPNLLTIIAESRIISHYPINQSINGYVVKEVIDLKTNNIDYEPISGVIVEIGGFQTITDINGSFTLDFVSPRIASININFIEDGNRVEKRILLSPKNTNSIGNVVLQ